MDDDEVNEEIAAAMGFSSFGGTKKRKFDQTNSPKAKPDASGANTTQLGVRPRITGGNDRNASKKLDGSNATLKDNQKQSQPAATGLAAFLNRGQNLPDKPATTDEAPSAAPTNQNHGNASETISFGGPSISRAELGALRHGIKTSNGDTAYFLPSFVEDPWANFRKA